MSVAERLPNGLRRRVAAATALPPVQRMSRIVAAMGEHDVSGLAAEMAYRFLFALFPFLIFLAAVVGFVGARTGQQHLFDTIMTFMTVLAPPEIQQVVNDWVAGVVSTQSPGLLTVGVAGALWGAAGGVGTLIKGLNRAYGVEETRPFPKVQGMALLTTVVLALMMLVGAGLYLFGDWLGMLLAAQFGLGNAFLTFWALLRGPAVAVGLALLLVLVYAVLPNRDINGRQALPGAVAATTGWVLLTLGFSFYISNFGSYDRTFGSLGAAVVLMVWMYAVGLILLIGGEINAVRPYACC
jgi:membrane protein